MDLQSSLEVQSLLTALNGRQSDSLGRSLLDCFKMLLCLLQRVSNHSNSGGLVRTCAFVYSPWVPVDPWMLTDSFASWWEVLQQAAPQTGKGALWRDRAVHSVPPTFCIVIHYSNGDNTQVYSYTVTTISLPSTGHRVVIYFPALF